MAEDPDSTPQPRLMYPRSVAAADCAEATRAEPANTLHASKHTTTTAAPANQYQAGDACQTNLKKVYAKQGLVCVNGSVLSTVALFRIGAVTAASAC